jgi:hypothetical protein
MRPAKTHTPNSHTGEPSCDIILAGFINMPDPIMPPTTNAMVEGSCRVRRKLAMEVIFLNIDITAEDIQFF